MISELVEQIFNWKAPVSSRTEAKRRLKMVIAHDRAGLTSEMVNGMRQEIMDVVARYVEIDPNDMDFCLETNDRITVLIANFPIRRVKNNSDLNSNNIIPEAN